MIEEFPDAYETSVVIAEQALQEAFGGNTEQVETYLRTLTENSPYTNIVTEHGLEAIPAIQTFLARQYIEQNRTEDASALLTQLVENYPDSLVVEPPTVGEPPGPGTSPPEPRPTLEIVTELQQQLGNSE